MSAETENLKRLRGTVPEVTEETILQICVSEKTAKEFLANRKGNNPQTVSGCCYRACDICPYVACLPQAEQNLKLSLEDRNVLKSKDLFVLRFTLKAEDCPSNMDIPQRSSNHTGFGFAPSDSHLIPEYVIQPSIPTDGAIYKIDPNGNETIIGAWDKTSRKFIKVR